MILRFFKRYGWLYLPGILFLALSSYIGTLAPQALGRAFDELGAGSPWSTVLRTALWIVAIALATFLTRFIWRQFIIGNSRNMQIFLRNELFLKLQMLPIPFFNHVKTGDLMAYAINDVNAVRQTFGPALSMFISGIVTSLFSIAGMIATSDRRLTLIALLPVLPAMVCILVIGSRVRRKFRRVQEQFALLSGHVQENINGMRVLKAFVQEDAQIDEFARESGVMRDLNVDLATTSAMLSPLIQVFFGVSAAACILYGGNLVLSGGMTLGGFVAFSGYLTLIMNPVIQLGRIVNLLQRGLASFRRLASVIDEPGIPPEEDRIEGCPDELSIEFSHLSFTYPDGTEPVLRDVSLWIPAGSTMGICGPTGSGKTTLASLLLKLFPPPEGALRVGGVDMRDIPARALRERIGYVPQDGFLFNTTLRENIVFFRPGATEADVERAVSLSGLVADLPAFPDGLNARAGERGNHLSGGQKQRVAIARALCKDPDLVILDDALSAVDVHMEKRILANLSEALRGKTAVIIAHRLSVVEHCDRIAYLEGGAIVETGTHEELLALGGRYADLYAQQMREAEGEEVSI